MNQPVRRRTDADATETDQLDVTGIFCGKLLRCPVRATLRTRRQSTETRTNTGLSRAIHSQAAQRHGRVARRSVISFGQTADRARCASCDLRSAAARGAGFFKTAPKMKDPSGGQPDGSSYMGRLGWMGARAEYSRWGGITAPTHISRGSLAGRSKRQAIF